MRRIMLTLAAAFVCCGVGQRSLPARDPAVDPAREGKEANLDQKAASPQSDRPGPAETLTGTINMVETSKNLIVVRAGDGTMFKFVSRRSTRVKIADRRLTLADLSASVGKTVSVKFVPTRHGNLARLIEVTE